VFIFHLEDHHFQSNGCFSLFLFLFKIHDDTENGHKCLILLKKRAIALDMETDGPYRSNECPISNISSVFSARLRILAPGSTAVISAPIDILLHLRLAAPALVLVAVELDVQLVHRKHDAVRRDVLGVVRC